MRLDIHGKSRPDLSNHALARGLGWLSIGLGIAEIAAPHRLARTLGLDGHEPIVFAYGVREVVNGIGILTSDDPTPWIWGRVGGDALDIATAATGMSGDNPRARNVAVALVSLLGITAVDLYCARALSEERERRSAPIRDYRDRTGYPRPVQAMRGAARAEGFEIPDDFRGPPALRPYEDGTAPLSTAAAHAKTSPRPEETRP
ncbi:cyclase dehydrase [Propylenella binzhouense]|uniref:Cyclase dehydrase n=1 Tax=Propylenella binzhouense TaxID=2555902 RepID=A0A964WS60_9HYPH|nr:cyclase dehydrase [Propylenella binzhouense]MYZ46612.1 cyclase dehydrase [Propylenella binzhouense]